MVFLWIGAIYGMGMIWATTALADRWKGPRDDRRIGFGSVLAAILLSTAWPLVLVYLILSG